MRIRSVKILVLHALLNVLDCMVEENKLVSQGGYCNIHLLDIVFCTSYCFACYIFFLMCLGNKLCSLIGLGAVSFQTLFSSGSFSFIT